MFGFIAFGFKILYAAIMGGALNYVPGVLEDNHKIVETSLICIFSTAVLGLANEFSGDGQGFTIGSGVLAVSVTVIAISKNMDFGSRIMWLFSSIIGMIIGLGYLIRALCLGVLVYFIIRNSEHLLHYIHKIPEDTNDAEVKNI